MLEGAFMEAWLAYERLRTSIQDRRNAKRTRDFQYVRLPLGIVATSPQTCNAIMMAWRRWQVLPLDTLADKYRQVQLRMHELTTQLDNVEYALIDMETEKMTHDTMIGLTQLESILTERMVSPLLPGLPMQEWPWDTMIRFLTVVDPKLVSYRISISGIHHHILISVLPSTSLVIANPTSLVIANPTSLVIANPKSDGVLSLFNESLMVQNCEAPIVTSMTHFTCKLPKDWQKQLPLGVVQIFEANHDWPGFMLGYIPSHERHWHLRPVGFFDQKRHHIESNHGIAEKKHELSILRLEFCQIPFEHQFKHNWNALNGHIYS